MTDSLIPLHGIEIKTVTEFFETLKVLCKDLPLFLVILFISFGFSGKKNSYSTKLLRGTAVAQWLSCCATNRKVAGSIPAHVIGFFIDIKSFRSHYGPGVDSASNRNVYQEHFLGVKAAGA